MKKLFILLTLLFTLGVNAQQFPTQWEVQEDHTLQLNYNLLGRHTAQGMFYGAAGYGTGMWLSENNIWWGLAGSLVATNLPILLEKKFDEPEVVIGRNLGNLSVNLAFSILIEKGRNGKYNFELPNFLRR